MSTIDGVSDPAAARARIEVSGLTAQNGSRPAIAGVTWSIGPGITVLLGRNGAGKSTLCRVLAGAQRPRSGTLSWRDDAVSGAGRREYLRRCGWLPQDFSAPSLMTVEQFVTYAAWLKEVPDGRRDERVRQALDRVGLTSRLSDRVSSLSGGMLRRLGIAHAVVHQPRFLILDEPTTGLDPEQRGAFYGFINDLARDCVVVVATHLLEDAVALADSVAVLDEGRLRFSGTPADLENRGSGVERSDRLRSGFLACLDPETEP